MVSAFFFVITVVRLRILPIDEDGFHIQLPVLINGIAGNFLLDTGASRTVFDINRVHTFIDAFEPGPVSDKRSTGLGTNSMEIYNTNIRSLSIGDIIARNFDAAILDLTHVNESYLLLGLEQIDGVLGNDLLLRYRAVIDYQREELTLQDLSGK